MPMGGFPCCLLACMSRGYSASSRGVIVQSDCRQFIKGGFLKRMGHMGGARRATILSFPLFQSCLKNSQIRMGFHFYDFQHDMLFQAVLLFFSGVSHFFCLRKKCERLEGNSRFPRGRFFAGRRPSFSRGPRASPARRGARRPRKHPSRRPAPRPVPSALYNNT